MGCSTRSISQQWLEIYAGKEKKKEFNLSFSVLVFLIYHPNMDSFLDYIMRPFNYIFYMVIFIIFNFCLQALISMAFQQKLTENLHECYLSNRVYYVASTLRGLSNADQVSFVLKTLGCV